MKPSYIPIKSSILTIAMMISAHAQPDTVVLNSTEFRFPETHPGRAFVVKKIVVNGQQVLKKSSETGNPASLPALAPPASAAAKSKPARDAMGRVLKSGEYAERMANIQKAHKLPTVAAKKSGVNESPRPVTRFQKSEGARFAVTSDSPLIKDWRDLARMEKNEREAVRRKYGALSKSFAAKVSALKENDSLDILIELQAEHPGYINGMKATPEERKRNAQAWVNAKPLIAPEEFARRNGLKVPGRLAEKARNGRTVPVRASRNQILGLQHAQGVVSVTQAFEPTVNAVPRAFPSFPEDILASAMNPQGTMVEYGGLAVATMESGLSEEYVNRVPYNKAPAAYDVTYYPFPEQAHSEGTYHMLAVGTTGHTRYHYIGLGSYYDGSYWNFGHGVGHILPQIVDDEISILSSSWAALNSTGSSVAGDSISGPWDELTRWDSRNVDRLAYIYPYPVIFLTAGNQGYSVTSDSKAYNSMVVGNVQHYDDVSYSVTLKAAYPGTFNLYDLPGSQTKNAPPSYGSDADWELPNLMAPGQTPDPGWGIKFEYVHIDTLGNGWHPGGGSSFSAPNAAAMGANVMAARYVSGPTRNTEARAILMLTAQNVDSGYWAPSFQDSRDGAGTVSGSNAVDFAVNATSVGAGNYPTTDAISSGYMDENNFDRHASVYHNILVPNPLPSGKHLRVVLTWNSSPGYNTVESEVSDMGLSVETNSGWTSSNAWNGNVEMLDIQNSDLSPGGTYGIEVYPDVFRAASDGPEEFNYTVAWTWVKDHAD